MPPKSLPYSIGPYADASGSVLVCMPGGVALELSWSLIFQENTNSGRQSKHGLLVSQRIRLSQKFELFCAKETTLAMTTRYLGILQEFWMDIKNNWGKENQVRIKALLSQL